MQVQLTDAERAVIVESVPTLKTRKERTMTRDMLRAELQTLTVEQLREYRANDYAESLADYNANELRQLVFDIWTNDGCRPLAQMTKDEVIVEIMDDVDEESTEEELTDIAASIRAYALEGDPTE